MSKENHSPKTLYRKFQEILSFLLKTDQTQNGLNFIDVSHQFNIDKNNHSSIGKALNSAFLVLLSGRKNPLYSAAASFLEQYKKDDFWANFSHFLAKSVESIRNEIENQIKINNEFRTRLAELHKWCRNQKSLSKGKLTAEKFWTLFFPEGLNGYKNFSKLIENLRKKRTVRIIQLNARPIENPAKQILFSGNILLTLPGASKDLEKLSVSESLKSKIRQALHEQQLFWYDHPIQIGVETKKNEAIYGLTGLQKALQFERKRGNVKKNEKITCILSVSVTHEALHRIAKDYIQEEIRKTHLLDDLDIYIFTEQDTQKFIEEILLPSLSSQIEKSAARTKLQILGVDGEYGRHYSFLKAIAAFWNVFINPEVVATFKIDLDQVFPQKELVEQTGSSAFEHFQTALWGAKGLNYLNEVVELGMLAGALVNQKDIINSLFTPDVPFPRRDLTSDEYIFFSALPQAISTEAEMMTQYEKAPLDGKSHCIQRVHVTGGTTGILVKSLFNHRPFTPSFIGRAEDQAYLFSSLIHPAPKLAYTHKDGLVMRHDKEGFVQDAIKSAQIGKIVGDYIRLLYFSKYGEIIQKVYPNMKNYIDPFTGCFYSKIPKTVVILRFILKVNSLFEMNEDKQAFELIKIGTKRIQKAFLFTEGRLSPLEKQYDQERAGWDLYYHIIENVRSGLEQGEMNAKKIQKRAENIINECRVTPG
jgi:hypothetical protein